MDRTFILVSPILLVVIYSVHFPSSYTIFFLNFRKIREPNTSKPTSIYFHDSSSLPARSFYIFLCDLFPENVSFPFCIQALYRH